MGAEGSWSSWALPEKAARPVAYANKRELEEVVLRRHPPRDAEDSSPPPQQAGTAPEATAGGKGHLDAGRPLRGVKKPEGGGA